MKDKTRQAILRAIGHRREYGRPVVYVPREVRLLAALPPHVTIAEAEKLGAIHIRAAEGNIVAEWPEYYFRLYAEHVEPHERAFNSIYEAPNKGHLQAIRNWLVAILSVRATALLKQGSSTWVEDYLASVEKELAAGSYNN